MGKRRTPSTKNGTLNHRVRVKVVFYRLDSGREPVREWLKQLDSVNRKIVGADLYTLQLGWPVGMPLSRKIEAGLWEQRSRSSPFRICHWRGVAWLFLEEEETYE